MAREIDLLKGNILSVLAKLAVPIMLTSMLQMTYNLVDMIWIGFEGANALAAVGAAGMFNILSAGLAVMAKMGGQVYLGQALGKGDHKQGIEYAQHALQLGLIFSISVGLICVIFANPLVSFFNFTNPKVIQDAIIYLMVCSGLSVFSFMNNILTGLVTAMGNSSLCFKVNAIGLVLNLVLDPLFIFGFLFIPPMHVAGAAVATVGAQAIVTLLFIYALKDESTIFSHINIFGKMRFSIIKNIAKGAAVATVGAQAIVTLLFIYALKDESTIFSHINIFGKMRFSIIKNIAKVGYPSALDNAFYSIISMIIARMIAGYGEGAVAVQKVGAQIESITWMVAQGYGMALNSFVAQNCGAGLVERIKKANCGAGLVERIKKAFKASIGLLTVWGIFTTLLLLLGAKPIMSIFIHEADVLSVGINYLVIISFSQLAMTLEYGFAGVFNGLAKTFTPGFISILFTDVLSVGINYLVIISFSQLAMTLEYGFAGVFNGLAKTFTPGFISILFTAIRVPLAYLLTQQLGLDGIWWTLTITSIVKTIVLAIVYLIARTHKDFYQTKQVHAI